MLAVELFLSFAALWLLRCFWRRWRYDLHKLPSPPGLPFFGQTFDLLKGGLYGDHAWLMGQWTRATGYAKIFKVSLLGHVFVYVRDMDCLKRVLLAKNAPFERTLAGDAAVIAVLGESPGGKGMVGTGQWTPYVKQIRQIYTTAFSSSGLTAIVPKVQGVLDVMIAEIEAKRAKGRIEFQELCVKLTVDIIGVVALGSNLGALDGSGSFYPVITEVGDFAAKRLFDPLLQLQLKLLPYSATVKRQERTIEALHAHWDALADDVLARDDPPAGEEPIWYGFRKAICSPESEAFNRPLLAYEIGTAIIAGMDSTGHQLAWILAVLGSHPHVVEKLLEELKEKGLHGKQARDATFEDLSELPYLTAIIKEGMRMVSIFGQSFTRVATADITLMGYRLPKGTEIVAPGSRWGDSVEDWGDPEVFRPGRWLTEEDISQRFHLGFSYGARECPGRRLAMMEMRLAIVRLVSLYNLSLSVPFENLMLDSSQALFIKAKNGIWIEAALRDDA